MTEILQKNYFRRVAQLVCRLLACMKPWVQSQARCKPRVMVQQKQEDQELQSQFVASLGYIRKDSKSHRETSLFIFTFASSASQNNKQKNPSTQDTKIVNHSLQMSCEDMAWEHAGKADA